MPLPLRPAGCGMPVDDAFREKAGYKMRAPTRAVRSRRHRRACLGDDDVRHGVLEDVLPRQAAHYVLGPEHASWLLLVADDLAVLVTQGRIRETVLMILTYLRVVGFPLSWKKLAGGENLGGLWVNPEELFPGTQRASSAVACRLVHQATPRQSSPDARVSRRPGAGSVRMWCTGLRSPVLAPLYAFAARHAPKSVKALLLYVLVTLEYLKKKILQRRHCPWVPTTELERGLAGGRTCGRERGGSGWLVAASKRERSGQHLRSKSHQTTHRGLSKEKGKLTE